MMIVSLVGLALGAVAAGALGLGLVDAEGGYWGDSLAVAAGHDALAEAHHVAPWVKYLPVALALAGIALAWLLYIRRPEMPERLAGAARGLYLFLLNKWYFDELYERLFVAPAKRIGFRLWQTGDGDVIDGLGPNGVAATVIDLARRASRLQTGYVYHYAFAMLIGVALLVTWYMIGAGG